MSLVWWHLLGLFRVKIPVIPSLDWSDAYAVQLTLTSPIIDGCIIQ